MPLWPGARAHQAQDAASRDASGPSSPLLVGVQVQVGAEEAAAERGRLAHGELLDDVAR